MGRVINGITSLALLSLLTSTLSAEAYGAYTLLFTFSVSLSTICYQWIAVSVFRFNNIQSTNRAALQGEAMRLYLFVCAAVVFLAPIIFYISLPELISLPVAIVMVGITVLAGLTDIQLNFATSSGQPVKYVIMSSGRAIAAISLVGLAFYIEYQTLGVLIAVAGSYFLAVSFGILSQYQSGKRRDPEVRNRIIRYGLPLSVSAIATIIIHFSDRYMLSIFYSLREVGTYSAAYDLSQQTIGALLSVVFVTVFPRISAAHEAGRIDQIAYYARMLLMLLLALGGGILTCFIWYSSNVSALVLGVNIASDAAPLMPLAGLAMILGVMKACVFDIPAKLKEHTRYLLAVSLFMASANLLLNLALIPPYGVYGAVFATIVTFALGMIASLIRDFSFWGIPRVNSGIFKLCIALATMNLFIYYTSETIYWVIGATLALSIYAGLIYVLDPILLKSSARK